MTDELTPKVWDARIRIKTDMLDDEEQVVSLINNMINSMRNEGVLFPSEAIFIVDVQASNLDQIKEIEDLVDDRGDPDG